MKETTLCYIEKDGCYLMLYRNKKKNDPNAGKWIGVGGHLEEGETPEECVRREVLEETGYTLESVEKCGEIIFDAANWPLELMHLYRAYGPTGEQIDCNEGELRWIPISEVMTLPLWEGDKVFLARMIEGECDIRLRLVYDGEDRLVKMENV